MQAENTLLSLSYKKVSVNWFRKVIKIHADKVTKQKFCSFFFVLKCMLQIVDNLHLAYIHVRQQSTGEYWRRNVPELIITMGDISRVCSFKQKKKNQVYALSTPESKFNGFNVFMSKFPVKLYTYKMIDPFRVILVQICYVHVFYIYIILWILAAFHAHPCFYTHTDTASKISDPYKSILMIWCIVVSSSIFYLHYIK